ncbi:MAG: hypothetical protein LM550_15300 [Candidatus Contendobacter sp.]|nr:hypothetical protein [Gammaproteobacteria bacterium]MCC8995017.1 hypothetical protein [Candidatus Contendobacter sp.]
MLILGQRTTEVVNQQALPEWRGWLQQLQRIVQKGHIAVERNVLSPLVTLPTITATIL